MCRPATLALSLFCASIAYPQSVGIAPRKTPAADKPACSRGAICFSGEVARGEEFRKALNDELEFVLARGWAITIIPKRPEGECTELASVVNAPYRAHRDLNIDRSYGWTAEEETSASPREFSFVTNCADYRTELARLVIVMWPYTVTQQEADEASANLGTSPLGKGRLWITDSRISHADGSPDDKTGRIEWMKFSVEIVLPRRW